MISLLNMISVWLFSVLLSFSSFWTEFDDKFNPGFVLIGDDGNVILDNDGRPKRRISQDIYDAIKRVI